MDKLNTVNVIEIPDKCSMVVAQLLSFPDTPEGNKEAEAAYLKLIRENSENFDESSEDDTNYALEEGHWSEDDYWVGIIHSTK